MKTTTVIKTAMIACSLMFVGHAATAQDAKINSLVKYEDLNLEDKDQAKALYFRLIRAAKKVCSASSSTDLNGRVHFKTCMDKAVSSAVAGINHPNLSHHHFVRTGEQSPALSVAHRQGIPGQK